MGTRMYRSSESRESLSGQFTHHPPPYSASYPTASALAGRLPPYDHYVAGSSLGLDPSVPRNLWSTGDIIATTTTAAGGYSVWSPPLLCSDVSNQWTSAHCVAYSNAHGQQSPVQAHGQQSPVQAHYTDTVPGLLSSPCTTISTRCNTPSDKSSMEDVKWPVESSPVMGMTPPNDFDYSPSHVFDGSMLYCMTPPSTQGYDAFGLVLHEVKQEPMAECNDQATEAEERTSPGLEEKIQLMNEKTKLLRKRRPNQRQSLNRPRCFFCDKRFSRSHNLHQHTMRMHSLTRIKLHRCDAVGCLLEFDRAADLLRHQISLHTNEKPFKCELCDVSFPRKDTLRRHYTQSCIKRRTAQARAGLDKKPTIPSKTNGPSAPANSPPQHHQVVAKVREDGFAPHGST